MKLSRKRSAGNPHAAFDVAGAGNMTKVVLGVACISKEHGQENVLPKVNAPVLDPTIFVPNKLTYFLGLTSS
jgi:hypothetical protein